MRELMTLMGLLLVTACASPPAVVQTAISRDRPPIIDMHLHAYRLADGTAPPENPLTGQPSSPRTTAELRDASLAALARYNIVKAVTSGPAVTQWHAAALTHILVGAYVDEDNPLPDLATLRADILAGRVHVLGELVLQHKGMAPNDPRLEPYYALAEELLVSIRASALLERPIFQAARVSV